MIRTLVIGPGHETWSVMHVDGEPDTAEIINACDDKCSREGLVALSPTERAVCLVNWLRFEVSLG